KLAEAVMEKIADDAISYGYALEMEEIGKEAAGTYGKLLEWGAKNILQPVKTFMKAPGSAFKPMTTRGMAGTKASKEMLKDVNSLGKGPNAYRLKPGGSGAGTGGTIFENKRMLAQNYGNMLKDTSAHNRQALKGLGIIGGGTAALGGGGYIAGRGLRK
ncbi:MAG: hypothetical protein Q8M92_00100, partial [Candidatus Subteraquimicrobiales bacterium]|nr:hypothetical protein [Candidatus Subteraquimicrobiales bacterium]